MHDQAPLEKERIIDEPRKWRQAADDHRKGEQSGEQQAAEGEEQPAGDVPRGGTCVSDEGLSCATTVCGKVRTTGEIVVE
jgi:hypothetical protein